MQDNDIGFEQIWIVTGPSGCRHLCSSEVAHHLATLPGWLVEPRVAGQFDGEE